MSFVDGESVAWYQRYLEQHWLALHRRRRRLTAGQKEESWLPSSPLLLSFESKSACCGVGALGRAAMEGRRGGRGEDGGA